MLKFMLEGPWPCTILCLMSTLQLNILIGTSLLVNCSNTFQNLCGLWIIKAKMLTKNITKKFVWLYNHCLLNWGTIQKAGKPSTGFCLPRPTRRIKTIGKL